MTKKQKQRAAVAKDVIAQLKAETMIAQAGVYVSGNVLTVAKIGDDLQSLIKEEVTTAAPCEVCAMGACFISAVRLYDKFTVDRQVYNDGDVPSAKLKRKVAEIFTRREMSVIESCFERRDTWLHAKKDILEFNGVQEKSAYAYSSAREDAPIIRQFLSGLVDNDRLIFLMEVVLANPTEQVTMRVVKNTLLRFFIEGKYPNDRKHYRL